MLEEILAERWKALAKAEGHEKGLPNNCGWVNHEEAIVRRAHKVADALKSGDMNKKQLTDVTGIIGYPLNEALDYAQQHLGIVKRFEHRTAVFGVTK